MSALVWYDSIIDDILTNPGTTMKQTAARLGRAATTICSVVSSDLFKARWAQRREQFSAALDARLTQKLAQVAEKGLDAQIEILEKKKDSIPLPILNETVKNSLDRLGYGPAPAQPAPVQVNVNNANVVSPSALARARENLRTLEGAVLNPREAGVPSSGESREAGVRESENPREASVRPFIDSAREAGSLTSEGPAGGPPEEGEED
jgi:hypothetical protein